MCVRDGVRVKHHEPAIVICLMIALNHFAHNLLFPLKAYSYDNAGCF